MFPCFALHLLGPPKLELDERPVAADQRKMLALLAYLAVNRWQHQRDHVSGLLWPDHDQARAFTNLRHILWEIQQAIGDGWVTATRDTIGLTPDGHRKIWLDVADFRSLLETGRAQPDASLRLPYLTDCAKLYRSHFLSGFSVKNAPEFNEWAFAESETLRRQLTEALSLLADDLRSLGQPDSAVPHAQRLVTLEPLNEGFHRQLMEIYVQAGQVNAALKQYQTCEKLIRKELGVDPQPETRALYKQIRKGEMRFVPTKRFKEAGAPSHNLPYQVSRFIGREQELVEIADLIANNRLVTLTGAGGIGKTRLSLKAGEQMLREFADGVWFIELAALSDPALVPQSVAKVFKLLEQPGEPVLEILIRVLRQKSMLLILDNCEHLLDASAHLADALLKGCPNLKILATSREPLGITGEAQYPVPPMGLPDVQLLLEQLLGFESVQLFDERARLVQREFALTMDNAPSIARICRRLDGIPLAIELAAARVNMFGVEQLAEQLEKSFSLLTGGSRTALPRHQTLRASIEWSWNLLSETESVLLRRLSVFAGGWTLEAAEAVCAGNGIEPEEVLDLMTQLVAKSLVVSKQNAERTTRYHLLEMIRQYAHERHQEAGEEEQSYDKHLAWTLAWSEDLSAKLRGDEQMAAMKTIDMELDNVRNVINRALNSGKAEFAMRVFIALEHYWDGYQPYQERRRWLELGISHSERLSTRTLARTYCERSWLAFRQNDAEP
ncbi:MAG: BTAD domain-containing putative transcriptional regulator, partial [Chloroflexota bacterium]